MTHSIKRITVLTGGSAQPDLVVNFCGTGFRNQAAQELSIPAYLDMLGIPYTGVPLAAMVLWYDKSVVRSVAESLTRRST
jgi:D-alanine-D-alanine ligase